MNNDSDESKIILIEGMSGTGKSILAQNIWFSYSFLGHQSEWFHEQESDHPLFKEDYLDLLNSNDISQFSQKIYNNWYKLLNQNNKKTFIFEGQILLSYLASMIWEGFSYNKILENSRDFIDLVAKNIHACILLETYEPEKIIKNTINNRGRKWKKWYFNEFNKSTYSRKNNVNDLDGLKQFWMDVFQLYNQFSKSFNNKTIKIDITDQNWQLYYTEISDYLEINIKNEVSIESNISIKKYLGSYICEERIISINIKEDKLYCDFGWPNLQLIPVLNTKDEFHIKGFPHQLQFIMDKQQIVITGKDIANLKDKVFTKKVD